MEALWRSFGAKEVGIEGQIRSSQNGNPSWPTKPNIFFEYEMRLKIPYKAS